MTKLGFGSSFEAGGAHRFPMLARRAIHHLLGLVAVAVLTTGCGGAPPPTDRLAASEAAIRGAQEVGAQSVPEAALHLKLAQEQVTKAKAMIDDGGGSPEAERLLMKAQADAELALALARENSTRAQAQNAMDQVKALKGGK
jgi:uncharacterized protein DUF4398